MSERETIKCPHCRLVQFKNGTDVCRRCKKSTAPPVPEPEPIFIPLAQGRPADLTRATQMVLQARRGEMSQRQLAKKIGCVRTYISKVERGSAMPVLGTLSKFASVFGIPLWVLVQEIETMQGMLATVEEL